MVIDCGETVFEALFRKGLLRNAPDIYVILTHLHADHVASLPTLISYYACIKNRQVNIISPDSSLPVLLDLMGIDRNFYRVWDPDNLPVDDIKLTCIPVTHVDDILCFGYIIHSGDETVYYSGDAADISDEVLKQFFNGNIARIYQDTCSSPSSHHCYVDVLSKRIPASDRKRIYCMHLDQIDAGYCTKYGFQVPKISI